MKINAKLKVIITIIIAMIAVIAFNTKAKATEYEYKEEAYEQEGAAMVAEQNDYICNSDYYVDGNKGVNTLFCMNINRISKVHYKISITNSAYKSRDYSYVGAKKTKVELPAKNIENTTVVVEYKIKVTNEGRVPGWVKSIVDYKPQGMQFESSLNSGWYETQDGELLCNLLENKEMKSGETQEVSLYLTRSINGENLGTINNTAEIGQLYNVYGYEDADSKEHNKSNDEDDISSADVTILMATGKEKASIIGITLGIISLIGVASYYIKKKVINKMYRDII